MPMAHWSMLTGVDPTGERVLAPGGAGLEDHRSVVIVGVLREVDEHGNMVARGVALALLALDAGIHHPVGEARRAEDEVDAHALIARKAQLLVVPEGEPGRHEGPHNVAEARLLECREGLALGGGDVGRLPRYEARVAHVGIGRSDVEVAHEGERAARVRGHPLPGVGRERPQEAQLVVQVGVVEGATVGHVEAPDPHIADRRADRARLERGIRALMTFREAGLAAEPDLDIGHRQAAGDGHAIPLVEAVQHDLVPRFLERLERELRGRALDLLHREHVDVGVHATTRPWRVRMELTFQVAMRMPPSLRTTVKPVTDARSQLIQLIRDEAVFHGDFTLTSGAKATYYIDLRTLSLDHRAAPLIGRVMTELIADIPDIAAVGGLTMGADPIASAVLHQAPALGRSFDAFVVRKAPKDHGRGKQVEGPDVTGKRVVVLEDTSTTGGSPLTAARALEAAGATVVAVAVVVDRATDARRVIEDAGYEYRAAIGLTDLGLA